MIVSDLSTFKKLTNLIWSDLYSYPEIQFAVSSFLVRYLLPIIKLITMKKILLLIVLLANISLANAQNQISSYALPSGYTNPQLRNRNALHVDASMSHFTSGVYIVEVKDTNGISVKSKLVKN